MKKLTLFAAAFVLALGLTTCKKENGQNGTTKTVHITVNVNNDSRAGINNYGHITFDEHSDFLFVGYDNQKVGSLEYFDGSFRGDITVTKNGEQPLYFYFMGGEFFYGTPPYTLDISNQTENFPVIASGTSTENYSSEVTSYTTTLLNQCGLVEFTTTNEIPVGKTIYISGVRNKVTLDFATNSITPSEETGIICLHTESTTVSRAILLPTTEPMTVTACAPGYSAVEITIPAIGDNTYLAGVNGPNFTLTENHIVDLSKILNDYEAQDDDVLTGTAVKDCLHITIAASARVTLSDATISGYIDCLGDATLVLADGTANSVHGSNSSYSGIYVPEGSTLTITDSGSLDVSGSGGGAGIGAFYGTNCGNIYIEGGTITATGGESAAGIGGGVYSDCGDITITSDVTRVTATGGGYGACCIGHSDGGGCGDITIPGVDIEGNCVGDDGTFVYEP